MTPYFKIINQYLLPMNELFSPGGDLLVYSYIHLGGSFIFRFSILGTNVKLPLYRNIFYYLQYSITYHYVYMFTSYNYYTSIYTCVHSFHTINIHVTLLSIKVKMEGKRRLYRSMVRLEGRVMLQMRNCLMFQF